MKGLPQYLYRDTPASSPGTLTDNPPELHSSQWEGGVPGDAHRGVPWPCGHLAKENGTAVYAANSRAHRQTDRHVTSVSGGAQYPIASKHSIEG